MSQSSGSIGQAVGLAESRLAALWQRGPSEPPKIRASTMNLVIVTQGEPPKSLIERIDSLSPSHPARVLFLAACSSKSALPAPEVSAICREEESGQIICSERVVFLLDAEGQARVSSIVSALSLADLPTVLFAFEKAPTALVEELADKAGRLIVDSRNASLDDIARQMAQGEYLADLGFIEQFPFRETLARAFDDEDFLPMLDYLETIELRYFSRPDGKIPNDARLYLGWLASRLGLSLLPPDRARFGERDIAIHISEEPAMPKTVGHIASVGLRGEISGSMREVKIERQEGCLALHALGRGEPRCHLFPLPLRDEAFFITRALDTIQPDFVLREAIVKALEWRA